MQKNRSRCLQTPAIGVKYVYATNDADFLIRGVPDTLVDRPLQCLVHPLRPRQ